MDKTLETNDSPIKRLERGLLKKLAGLEYIPRLEDDTISLRSGKTDTIIYLTTCDTCECSAHVDTPSHILISFHFHKMACIDKMIDSISELLKLNQQSKVANKGYLKPKNY